MSNLNRFAVTVRFNRAEQLNLAALCQFWGVDEKKVIKFAVEQMVTSTKQLQERLNKEKEAAPAEQPTDTQPSEAAAG